MIDLFILAFIFALIASIYPSELMIAPTASTEPPKTISELMMTVPQLTPPGIFLFSLMMWLYYAFFEASSWQATPGKRLLRLYVTDLAGRPVTFWRASLRNFVRIISQLTLLVGYILAGFTKKKQALHDLLAGCLVLRRP